MSTFQSQSAAFTFSEVIPRYTESREISMSTQPSTLTGIDRFTAQCRNCDEQWSTSHIQHAYGGVLVTCPRCKASEALRLSALLDQQSP